MRKAHPMETAKTQSVKVTKENFEKDAKKVYAKSVGRGAEAGPGVRPPERRLVPISVEWPSRGEPLRYLDIFLNDFHDLP
jgi:hypothetical protein